MKKEKPIKSNVSTSSLKVNASLNDLLAISVKGKNVKTGRKLSTKPPETKPKK